MAGIDEFKNAGGQVLKFRQFNRLISAYYSIIFINQHYTKKIMLFSDEISTGLQDAEIDLSSPNSEPGSNPSGFFHSFSPEDIFNLDQIKDRTTNKIISMGKFGRNFRINGSF